MIEKLQYITQETATLSHIYCVREACIAGVKWIQLRVKNKSNEEYLEIANWLEGMIRNKSKQKGLKSEINIIINNII